MAVGFKGICCWILWEKRSTHYVTRGGQEAGHLMPSTANWKEQNNTTAIEIQLSSSVQACCQEQTPCIYAVCIFLSLLPLNCWWAWSSRETIHQQKESQVCHKAEDKKATTKMKKLQHLFLFPHSFLPSALGVDRTVEEYKAVWSCPAWLFFQIKSMQIQSLKVFTRTHAHICTHMPKHTNDTTG